MKIKKEYLGYAGDVLMTAAIALTLLALLALFIVALFGSSAEAAPTATTSPPPALTCNVLERPVPIECQLTVLERHVINQFTARIGGVRTVAFACLKELVEYEEPRENCRIYQGGLALVNFYFARINKIEPKLKNAIIAQTEHVYTAFLAHDKVASTGVSILQRMARQ